MDAVNQFIADARKKGLDDTQIKHLLRTNGWTEKQAEEAVTGLSAPSSPAKHRNHVNSSKAPSIGALESALHHVLLWVFTLTSSIMISTVSYALLGGTDTSYSTLWAYIVVELVTFIPFAVLYVHYLLKLRVYPNLKTGRVWSIITIVLHSVAFIAAIITFILALILADGDAKKATVVASLALASIFALVVGTYTVANFTKVARRKKELLTAFPILLFIVIAFMGVGALQQIPSLRADEKTREQLVEVAQAIRKETVLKNALPTSIQTLEADTKEIEYAKETDKVYKLCAAFQKSRNNGYSDENLIEDGYVSTYDFENVKRGKQCFTIQSTKMSGDTYYGG